MGEFFVIGFKKIKKLKKLFKEIRIYILRKTKL